MPMLIAITVYDVDEVCDELARRTGKTEKYSRQRIGTLIKQKIPAPQKIGKRYLLTEAELNWLATQLQIKKRRKFY